MGRKKQYSREEVLTKALAAFWERGYENTSMRDLAAATGINAFSLYAEFKDKQSLFAEALNRYQTDNYRFAAQILSADSSGFERVEQLFLGLLKQISFGAEGKGCLTVNTTVLAKTLDNHIVAILKKNDRDFIRLFNQVIKEGQADRSINQKVSADKLAALLYTTHHGIRVIQHTQQNETQLRNSVECMLLLLRR